MHLDGTHFLREILRGALYQSLPQISGKLCARISGEVHTAACGSTHSCDNLLGGTALHRAGDEYPSLSVRIVHCQLYGNDIALIFQRRNDNGEPFAL